MACEVYGKENPSRNDVAHLRSGTCEFWKKSISHFMNTTSKWNEEAETGNPTQSKAVNEFINAMKLMETRGIGKETQADRSFTMNEFHQVLNFTRSKRTRAMMTLQYTMMARMDDTAHVRKDNLKVSDEFEGYLTCKMRWSKNVQTEHDCPAQVLVAAEDSRLCVYLHLALWLEEWITCGGGTPSQWLFNEGTTSHRDPMNEQDKEVTRGKTNYQNAVKRATSSDDFIPHQLEGHLGSHSIRKLAASQARRAGVPKDDVDYRGRWKDQKRMQDRYTDLQLTWPDVNCAISLCPTGAITYKLHEDAAVTDLWLATHVTPAIAGWWSDATIAAILAKPLLWACFDPIWSEQVEASIRNRCIRAFNNFPRPNPIPDGVNPVERIAIFADRGEGVSSVVLVCFIWIDGFAANIRSFLSFTYYSWWNRPPGGATKKTRGWRLGRQCPNRYHSGAPAMASCCLSSIGSHFSNHP
jgi:hypothetical protein